MFARFKKILEPIERPYCYLLLVTIGDGVFGRQNMCYDLIVICYLLFVIFAGA